MGIFGSVDLIPGINVGHAWTQLTGGGDRDIIDDVTFKGGDRNPGAGTEAGSVLGVSYGPQSYANQDMTAVNNPTQPSRVQNQQAPVDTTYTDSTGRSWASRAAFDNNAANVRRNAGVAQSGYEAEGRTTAQGNRQAYNIDAQDLVTGQRTGQNTINSGRVNNALNLRRSMAAIASGLRQGIRSGAVNLANMNAMDSGAAEAMARAFARQGNAQAGTVNNEAQLVENQLGTEQKNLQLQREQGLGRLKSWRDNKVNEISTKLWQNLSELDAKAQNEGVSGAVDMSIRDRVVTDASRMLDEVDRVTQAELAKITGLDYGQVQEQAAAMDAAGAQANPFAYEGGVQWGNPGAGIGNMGGAPIGPIGTAPRYRDEQGLTVPLGYGQTRTEDETVRA